MKRSNILIRNTVFNFSSSIWFVLLQFFTTPYIVRKLGTDAYGIYSILFVVIGYFGFLELGLGRALIKHIADLIAKEDFRKINDIINTALLAFLGLGISGALILSALAGLLVTYVFKIPLDMRETAELVFYIAAAGFFFNMPANVLSAVPKALQRFDITNKIDILIGSLQTLLTVYLLYLGFFLRELITMNVLISILSLSTYAVVLKRMLPQIRLRPRFSVSTFMELFRFGGAVAVDNILTVLSSRLNTFFMGVFHPIALLPYFVVPNAVASKISFIPRGIGHTVFPAFSELKSASSPELLKELYLRATRYIVMLTVPFFVLFTVFASKFLLFWMGQDFASKGWLALVLIGTSFIMSSWASVSVEGARGVGRPDIPAKIQLFLAVINIVLCFTLIPRYGVVGAALAWSVHRFILIPIFIWFVANRLFSIGARTLWKESFMWPFALGSLTLLLSYPLSIWSSSMPALLGSFFILSALYLTLSYFIILDAKDRAAASHYLRKNIYSAFTSVL